jgi:two-component system, OmpR family, phosphate regulon sensor histidine kinase PhoR
MQRFQRTFAQLSGSGDVDLPVLERPEPFPASQPDHEHRQPGVEAGMPLEADRPRAVFKYLFPFWQVEVSPPAGQNLGNRDTLVFSGITALILVTLVTGVLLLMRDNWRQWQLNQLRSSLVTGISHDLKTPVTGIRVYADILADGTELTEEDRKKYSRIIQRESERLTNTIERVLDFSRIEKGRRPYCFEEGDLTPVLVRMVEMYRTYWSPRGFSIVTDFASSVPLVRFDEEAVSQAVLNLLDNAVKYSGDGRDIKVELRVNDRFVVVSVADCGIGIAHSEQSRIFEEFYRAQPQHGKGGVGLGPYLVRQIMDAHAGRVDVESELGCGSRFQLIFPVAWPKS